MQRRQRFESRDVKSRLQFQRPKKGGRCQKTQYPLRDPACQRSDRTLVQRQSARLRTQGSGFGFRRDLFFSLHIIGPMRRRHRFAKARCRENLKTRKSRDIGKIRRLTKVEIQKVETEKSTPDLAVEKSRDQKVEMEKSRFRTSDQ